MFLPKLFVRNPRFQVAVRWTYDPSRHPRAVSTFKQKRHFQPPSSDSLGWLRTVWVPTPPPWWERRITLIPPTSPVLTVPAWRSIQARGLSLRVPLFPTQDSRGRP